MPTETILNATANAEAGSSVLVRARNSPYVGVLVTDAATTVTIKAPRTIVSRGEFQALADWWHEATGHLSDPDQIARHAAYQRILELGRKDRATVLRYVLEDLRDRGGHWYAALRTLADQSPVAPEHRGKTRLMKQDWLRWARQRDIIA